MYSAFIHHPLCPVRAEARDASEMVTQLLFGDVVEVLEEQKQWRKIRNLFDGYEGWIDHKLMEKLPSGWKSEDFSWAWVLEPALRVRAKFGSSLTMLPLTLGCRIPVNPDWEEGTPVKVQLGDFQADLLPGNLVWDNKKGREGVLEGGMRYLGAPYLWGGKSLWGIDCSGLTQMACRLAGLELPRDAWQQAEKGTEVSFGEHQPGDLAFFHNAKGRIAHVGICLEEGQILHAHGRVRVDPLHKDGIYHAVTGEKTHSLTAIRSYF